MARCTVCGNTLNHYGKCSYCARASLHAKFAAEGYTEKDFPRLEAEERERQVREAREAVEKERKRVVREACEPFIEFLRKRSARNLPFYLYNSVYVPVNSVVDDDALNDGFSINSLQDLGLQGWEIVQVIPRTVGVALKNIVEKITYKGDVSYGGGIGGNVAGVYVLLRKELRPGWEDDQELSGEVRGFVEKFLGYSAA